MIVKGKNKILIVDDSKTEQEYLISMLNQNYIAISVMSGEAALEILENEIPDLILMDIIMEGIDGLEACRKIKQNDAMSEVPIIFLTARQGIDDKLKAFEAGGVDYITKPFIDAEVIARINIHLRLKNAIEELDKKSITDELTQVYNRRYAYVVLERKMAMAERDKKNILIVFVDADGLKKVNDTFGHDAGDNLTLTISDSIQAEIRTSDSLFRMGGDEFLIIMYDAEESNAETIINRIKKNLSTRIIQNTIPDFSYGIAVYTPMDKKISPDELVKRADRAMYTNKKAKVALRS